MVAVSDVTDHFSMESNGILHLILQGKMFVVLLSQEVLSVHHRSCGDVEGLCGLVGDVESLRL